MATDWMKWLREFSGWDRDDLKMYPDEVVSTLQYAERLKRLYPPNPLEGEVVSKARSCFLLRYYSGKREIFWANTETQELIPLSFLVSYSGQREYYPDLEIGTPKG